MHCLILVMEKFDCKLVFCVCLVNFCIGFMVFCYCLQCFLYGVLLCKSFILFLYCLFVCLFTFVKLFCNQRQKIIAHVQPSFLVTKVTPIEWPLEESQSGRFVSRSDSRHNIADYLMQKKIDLVINLPLRIHRMCSIVTHGYRTRRLAIENHIPLITDVKCAKLFVKVRVGRVGVGGE